MNGPQLTTACTAQALGTMQSSQVQNSFTKGPHGACPICPSRPHAVARPHSNAEPQLSKTLTTEDPQPEGSWSAGMSGAISECPAPAGEDHLQRAQPTHGTVQNLEIAARRQAKTKTKLQKKRGRIPLPSNLADKWARGWLTSTETKYSQNYCHSCPEARALGTHVDEEVSSNDWSMPSSSFKLLLCGIVGQHSLTRGAILTVCLTSLVVVPVGVLHPCGPDQLASQRGRQLQYRLNVKIKMIKTGRSVRAAEPACLTSVNICVRRAATCFLHLLTYGISEDPFLPSAFFAPYPLPPFDPYPPPPLRCNLGVYPLALSVQEHRQHRSLCSYRRTAERSPRGDGTSILSSLFYSLLAGSVVSCLVSSLSPLVSSLLSPLSSPLLSMSWGASNTLPQYWEAI